ncbi:Transcriptional regulatory protein CssR [Acholeplasma oculi]|uniref:Two-component system response regulator with the CheY-like receiver domain n=1 Tax=Acholeplasma oculi TaxID=35623 RepID=A0A061ACB0_9MOLU|nr:response regulator transcription factor [Acholeplasma oculi]CDR31515.1 Two-component system response regulator with the CheY-like receiver domain [Acholeplasma oculi]SKC49557.1 two-component system, OmpR family, response regulator CssR [Acholeplasma oculi]SUT92322.1 Transcriptional regulatory protein CssR [Acholeplasma oculi]
MKIYYVEDERDLSEIIRKYLTRENYDVTVFYDGETAIKHAADTVDLWILDIMLTGEVDGFDLIKAINQSNPDAAIIFTSARDQALDKIKGLELGSDDYLAKPFSPRELILRVKAVLKRKNSRPGVISYSDYSIQLDSREIRHGDKQIELTNKEFEMLLVFLKNKQQPIERTLLLETIWGKNYVGSDRVVDDLLRRLRSKMPLLRIETIYGYGYRLL